MNAESGIALLVAVAALCYLLYALVRPENL
jgi:K+-transporting ATPase KdpF subunit